MVSCRCTECDKQVWDEDYCQTCDGETCCGQDDEEQPEKVDRPDEDSEDYWDNVSNTYEENMGF